MWVADTKNKRLQSWNPVNHWTPQVPPGAAPVFTRPYDVAVDARGDLSVAHEAGLARYARFQEGTFGLFDVREDGSFVYQAKNLAGIDEVTWTVNGPGPATSTVKVSVVVTGACAEPRPPGFVTVLRRL